MKEEVVHVHQQVRRSMQQQAMATATLNSEDHRARAAALQQGAAADVHRSCQLREKRFVVTD